MTSLITPMPVGCYEWEIYYISAVAGSVSCVDNVPEIEKIIKNARGKKTK